MATGIQIRIEGDPDSIVEGSPDITKFIASGLPVGNHSIASCKESFMEQRVSGYCYLLPKNVRGDQFHTMVDTTCLALM
jgi:hypothetical protein